MEGHIRDILVQIGEDPDRQGLRRTPQRVRESLAFLTSKFHIRIVTGWKLRV